MQTLPAKDYAAITNPDNRISVSPGDDCTGMGKTGQLTGFTIGVRYAVIPFFQSLLPCYQRSSTNNDTPELHDSGPAALTGQSMLKDICQNAGLVAQLAGAWIPEVRVLADVVSKLSVYGSFGSEVMECMQETCPIRAEPAEKKCTAGPPRSVAQGSSVSGGVLAVAAIVALGQIPVAAASHESSRATNHSIPVPDRETLEKIGQSSKYPLSGHYIQTRDINSDVSIGSEDQPFYGHYDGGCHTISGQRRCLFGKLAEHGVVSNLRMAHAHVECKDKHGCAVVVCKMGEGSRLENLLVEHSSVLANQRGHGDFEDQLATAGVVTGHQQENSYVEHIGVNNCSVTGTAEFVSVGILSGRSEGDIRHSTVNNGRAKTVKYHSRAGIGAGMVEGRIDHFTVLNSQVESAHTYSFSGIGAGSLGPNSRLKRFTAVNCSVTTRASQSKAGIGAGECRGSGLLKGITAIACNVTTSGDGSNAGIGVGQSHGGAFDIRAIHCLVNTSGNFAHAAIGAGYFTGGRTEGITVVDSSITASGKRSKVGVGAGKISNSVDLNEPYATVNMTNSVRGINVSVNGELQKIGNLSQQSLDQLCDIADQRFVASDCRVTGQYSKGDWNCTSSVSPSVLPSAGTPVMNTALVNYSGTSGTPVMSTALVNYSGTSGTPVMSTALVNYSGTSDISVMSTALVNFSGTPALSLVTGAQAGTALSAGIIAGISVGAVGVLGLGAFCAWRHYHHRQGNPDALSMMVLENSEVAGEDC